MAPIAGIVMGSGAVPSDTADTYPVQYEQYGYGGYRTVATIADRNALPVARLNVGCLVHVLADGNTYRLKTGFHNPTVDGDWDTLNLDPGGDLWDRVGTVLTPHNAGDSVAAYDYRSTKQVGVVIGPNLWAANSDFSDWTGLVPDNFEIISFSGGSGSSVLQESVIYKSAPYSAKIYAGTGGMPDDLLGRVATGLTPGVQYGTAINFYREAGVDTDVQFVILNAATFAAATEQWVAEPSLITYSAPSGSFTAGDTISTPTGNGYILAVAATELTIIIVSGSFTLGQTLTSGLGVTATEDADATDTTGAWFPLIPNYPISKNPRLTVDGWVEEGVLFTGPASGVVLVVWTVEDTKTVYVDDVYFATYTITNGTVFDFITDLDGTTLTSLDKIFNFRYTGGTGGSALYMRGDGAIQTDMSYINFADDVHITEGGTLTVDDDSFLSDTEVDLLTNNLAGASTDYIVHLFDQTARTTAMSLIVAGAVSAPVTTAGYGMVKTLLFADCDNASVYETKYASRGLGIGELGSGEKFIIYDDAADLDSSYISGVQVVSATNNGAAKQVGMLLDQRNRSLAYGVLSLGGDLHLTAIHEPGAAGDGPDIYLEAGAAGGAGEGGSAYIQYAGGSGGGNDGTIKFRRETSTFGELFTDDKNAVLFMSRATDSASTSAFMLYTYENMTEEGCKLLSVGDNISGTPSEKFWIDYIGRAGFGSFGEIQTDDKNDFVFLSKATDASGASAFVFGASNDLGTGTLLLSLGDNASTSYSEKFRIDYKGAVLLEDGSSAEPILAFNSNIYSGVYYEFDRESIGFTIQNGIAEDGTTKFQIRPEGVYSDMWNARTGALMMQGSYTNGATSVAVQMGGQIPLTTDGANILELFSTPIFGIGRQTYSGADALQDLFVTGTFNGAHPTQFVIEIDGEGTGTGGVDTFRWSNNGGVSWNVEDVDITGAAQTLVNGVSVRFKNLTGHTVGDKQEWDVAPIDKVAFVDISGGIFAGNTANKTDFTKAFSVFSESNTGATSTGVIGVVSEVSSDGTDAGYGFYGFAVTNATIGAAGIAGMGKVSASTDTGPAYGGFFSSTDSHDGDNAAVIATAANLGTGDAYSFYGVSGILYNNGNVGIGSLTYGANAAKVLSIANGTAPSAHVDNTIQIYSVDSSDNTATLGLMLEQAVEDGAPTPDKKVKVLINGTEYWLGLDAV